MREARKASQNKDSDVVLPAYATHRQGAGKRNGVGCIVLTLQTLSNSRLLTGVQV